MHESTLARTVLAGVLDLARRHGGARVTKATGWIAETEHLDPESIAFHFAAHARGTAAEGARLELELRHVEARCTACGGVYAPTHHVLSCPRCGSAEAELLGETGLRIEAIEVEDA